ncbi:hypothetical protein [Chondrinema litorale]|uniref:hypothetical protein n=1 Tax=Chondrinema litorale TaxID=2994555 RepID=UPI0025431E47|nr:hypothetical protein [Chondrinema litorale]UZR93677.1 hypothetical protein OQ292_17660 [Chondrinema litorale]
MKFTSDRLPFLVLLLLSSCASMPNYMLTTDKPVSINSYNEKINHNLHVDLQYVSNSWNYLIFNLEIENQGHELFVFNDDYGIPESIYIDQGIMLYEGFPESFDRAIPTEEVLSRIDYELVRVRKRQTGRQVGLGVVMVAALIATELSEDEEDRKNVDKQLKKELQQNTIMTGASIINSIDENTVVAKVNQLELERERVLRNAFNHQAIASHETVSGYVYIPLVEGRRNIKVYVPLGNSVYEFSFSQRRN